MGTCSKALGGMGAYVAGSARMCEYLLNHASGFIYSTALPPAVLGAIDAALDLIPTMDDERTNLSHQSQYLRALLQDGKLETLGSTTQIVPVLIGDAKRALAISKGLEEAGFLSIAIRPPTVPPNTARLRLALDARYTTADIEALAEAIITLTQEIST